MMKGKKAKKRAAALVQVVEPTAQTEQRQTETIMYPESDGDNNLLPCYAE
jgi:hypothetical protein